MTPAAFFDLDKTVIARASMVAMGRPLYREGMISRTLLLRALWGQLAYLWFGADEAKLVKMRDSVLRITAGWERETVRRIAREAIGEFIEPIVYAEALDLIADHKVKGHAVYLVSASPEEIVAPLADHLGVEYLATVAEVDLHGRYTGRVERYCYGPEKVVAIEAEAEARGLDLEESYAYSDSVTDEPMLGIVGHPYAVNPDRALLTMARERGWAVRWFVRPIRLRDRIPRPATKPTVAVGSGLAAAAAAAGVAWWLLRRGEGGPMAAPPAPPSAQAWRTFLAATNERPTRTRRSRSFFTDRGA